MKRLSSTLSRKSWLTINKSIIRPNLDYANIFYEKHFNKSFSKRKKGTVQYKLALVITGMIKETFHDRLYKELGLESLGDRR